MCMIQLLIRSLEYLHTNYSVNQHLSTPSIYVTFYNPTIMILGIKTANYRN